MRNQVVKYNGITVRYQHHILLENFSFAVSRGEHWALVGPSGSGKSVLLDALAGKLPISKGQAAYPLLDEVVREQQQEDPLFNRSRLIGYVSARHGFRTHSNTTEFYYQQRFDSSHLDDIPTVEAYLQAIVAPTASEVWTYGYVTERLHLEHLLGKHLIKLSNGETRRLLIGAALLQNPLLLLLDNPFAGLDVAAREELNHLLQEIARSGITLLMATSPAEVPEAVTHVAVLERGILVQQTSRAKFMTSGFKLPVPGEIATGELRELLSLRPYSTYEVVVGMQQVNIRYGENLILDNVNWTVRQGERWALLGHNGAGKSTLLSLINGDNPQAYANKIVLFDKVKGKGLSIWDIKKQIGYVSPELFQYFPAGSTCLEVIESGFYDSLGLMRASEAANAALALRWMHLLEIDAYAAHHFRSVPASIQRLCLLARALAKNPPLLILDEPCQGLDARQQQHFKQVVEAICASSRTTLIYVSHYQQELPASITHTLKLQNGSVRSKLVVA
ncbi:ATP-binding cassette domain-containing protein [Pontibacter chitinilyticus]|uniref:ATP-binding cassette domain-containing protein n=1 Tax=Pontibacter chitinilyticus TaxID=2674989 RepID=UPI00321922BA